MKAEIDAIVNNPEVLLRKHDCSYGLHWRYIDRASIFFLI
jgi:hypothetical protein